MSVDVFEQHLNDWLRGVHAEDRARKAQRNAEVLVNGLIWRLGCTVRYDMAKMHIIVNPDSDCPLSITLDNAQHMSPEILLGWVKERIS